MAETFGKFGGAYHGKAPKGLDPGEGEIISPIDRSEYTESGVILHAFGERFEITLTKKDDGFEHTFKHLDRDT